MALILLDEISVTGGQSSATVNPRNAPLLHLVRWWRLCSEMGRAEGFRSVQVLRAVAALAVAFAHAAGLWEYLTSTPIAHNRHVGTIGVDVFFVISGFIVTLSAMRSTSAGNFLKRRFLRVAPLYYLWSIPALAIGPLPEPPVLASIFPTVFFWPEGPDGWIWPVLGVGWTLCFEMLFYAAAAAIIAGGRKAMFITLGILSLCWLAQHFRLGQLFNFLGSPLIAEFLFGAIIAAFWRRSRIVPGAMALTCSLLIIFLWVEFSPGWVDDAPTIVHGNLGWYRVAMFGLPAIGIVWGALQFEELFKHRYFDAAVHLGDASYSLYLTHLFILYGAAWLGPRLALSAMVTMSLGFLATVPAALLAYRWVEGPMLLLGRSQRPSEKIHIKGCRPSGDIRANP